MKFSNLEEIIACKNSLTIIRSNYFNKMRRVKFIDISFNKISSIEAGSFKDLFNVKYLFLGNNEIETIDRDLFQVMIDLKSLDLAHNRINSLDPAVFLISGGILIEANLLSNSCLNRNYKVKDYDLLEDDIISYCQPD